MDDFVAILYLQRQPRSRGKPWLAAMQTCKEQTTQKESGRCTKLSLLEGFLLFPQLSIYHA
jgi:hypothetical protein